MTTIKSLHWKDIIEACTFSVGVVNEDVIEKALSIRMKTGYKTWLTVQNTLLVNGIIIVKIESPWNQIS